MLQEILWLLRKVKTFTILQQLDTLYYFNIWFVYDVILSYMYIVHIHNLVDERIYFRILYNLFNLNLQNSIPMFLQTSFVTVRCSHWDILSTRLNWNTIKFYNHSVASRPIPLCRFHCETLKWLPPGVCFNVFILFTVTLLCSHWDYCYYFELAINFNHVSVSISIIINVS